MAVSFSFTFNSNNDGENEDGRSVHLVKNFSEDPSWPEVVDVFQDFLQGVGYVFKQNHRFDMVSDTDGEHSHELVFDVSRGY